MTRRTTTPMLAMTLVLATTIFAAAAGPTVPFLLLITAQDSSPWLRQGALSAAGLLLASMAWLAMGAAAIAHENAARLRQHEEWANLRLD